jgi:hypothetical protein
MEPDYHSIKALSNSALTCLKQSPEVFRDRYILGKPQAESDAFRIGSAVHCLVLEPHLFSDRFAMAPKVDRRTKQGKADWAAFQESVGGRELLTEDEHAEIVSTAQAFGKHAGLTTLLGSCGRIIEKPIEFELFGEKFKAKPDCVIPSWKVIIDIKTTASVKPRKFAWSAIDYGYHRQAAIYMHACEEKYKEPFRFLFACVEKKYPYEVAVFELDERSVSDGVDQVEKLVEEYKRRIEQKDWLPNYSKGIVPLHLPKVREDDYEESE